MHKNADKLHISELGPTIWLQKKNTSSHMCRPTMVLKETLSYYTTHRLIAMFSVRSILYFSRFFHSCIFQHCSFVPHFPVSHFPPPAGFMPHFPVLHFHLRLFFSVVDKKLSYRRETAHQLRMST